MKRACPVYLAIVAVISMVSAGGLAAPGLASSFSAAGPVTASAARVISLTDTVHMRLVSKRGSVLNERGEARGSLPLSPLVCTFTDVNAEHGTATLTGYSHGSSLTGRATLSAYAAGHISHFEGFLTIGGGTGSYAHTHGHHLLFKGTIDRHDFHASAEISGKLQQ